MRALRRLRRWVAPGLRILAGGHNRRPDAGERQEAASELATRREVLSLAWPIATAMLGETAMGLVDTILVGGLGAAALGGVGIATVLMFLNYAMVFGLMRGVKVRTAFAVGQQRRDEAIRYAQAGSLIGVVSGTLVWALSRDVTAALGWLHIDPATVPYARDFLAARTFGAPFVCILSALIQYRQGLGDSRTPMVIGLFGNLLNASLAYTLIYGHFGMPALGVAGAGYGTAITEAFQVSLLASVVVREQLARRRAGGAVPVNMSLRRALGEVSQLGVPTGLQFGLEALAFTAFTAILGGLGASEIAGHQVAMAIIRVSFLPGVAVAEAASVLVGRSLGARSLVEADRVTRGALLLAVSFMSLCGMAFGLFGGRIASLFTSDPGVAIVVRKLLLLAAVFQTLDAVTIVLRGALRGAKDVRMVALIGITVIWVFVPSAAFLLGRRLGWGAVGGWCGFIGETTVSAVLFWWRWKRGTWRAAYEHTPVTHASAGTLAPSAA